MKNEKDLGLIVNEDLGWDDNIRSCIKDANRCIAWVSRNLLNRDSYILARVYKTIIRPKPNIAYNCEIQLLAMAFGQLFWSWNQSSGGLLVSLMTLDFCPTASGWKNELNNSW